MLKRYPTIGQQLTSISASSGTYSKSTTGWADVTNLTLDFQGTGRELSIAFVQDGSANLAYVGFPASNPDPYFRVLRDANLIFYTRLYPEGQGSPHELSFQYLPPDAAQYTYKLQLNNTNAFETRVYYVKMRITEIG